MTPAIEPIASFGHWTVVLAVIAPIAVAKVVVSIWVTRGADPKDRVAILKAVAELFRWWRR